MSNNFLQEMMGYKRQQVAARRQVVSLAEMRSAAENAAPALDLLQALKFGNEKVWPALIAEIKFASPSKGRLRAETDPQTLAQVYQANGAAAVSVLTDERYFQGSLDYLTQVAALTPRLPVLRKDFICDPYQVYEARSAGADAVLLIVAALDALQLVALHQLTLDLGMTPLVEIHTLAELEIALGCQPRLLGVNNRDLYSFQEDLDTTIRLRPYIPDEVCLVAESGIRRRADVAYLAKAGVDAILVGEALVTAADIEMMVRELADRTIQ